MDTSFLRGESSSSQSSHSPKWNYDVFISFRGEDTRKTFTGHLYSRLRERGINTFIDDEELRKGEVVSKELEKAIEGSGFSIVVLSENYASSSWCLDELVKILECKDKLKQVVLPVFYKVDPSHVRKQTGSFGEALAKHKERFGAQRMAKWTAALTEVANLSGLSLQDVADGYEFKFIENIIERVLQKINQTPLDVAWRPVGVDSRVKDIELLLQRGSEDEVRMVGIYGVGGIGKTTLAKAIYNRIFGQFDSSCFLSNVRSEAEQYNGVLKIQEKLLHQILRHEFKVSSVDEGVNLIKARLGSKKVLVVLDDVDHRRQLESLARERSWFGSGSVIIITTRDQHVLCMLRENERHQAKLLVDNEAQQLFSFHAFKCLSPPQEYLELAQGVIEYSGGLPLALAALGSHLEGKSVREWGCELKRLREIPHRDIQEILKISFDGLDCYIQSVFLDIACAFHGFNRQQVIEILNACGFHSEIAIATLERKCLLQRDRYCLVMHDLVRDMGREIVRMESTQYPGKRSRLFNPQEVCDVLQGNKGSEMVEVLMVDPRVFKGVNLRMNAFEKMKNLRVLKIDKIHFSGDFELLSKELRWLSWQNCPLEDIPSHFAAEKLVILDLCGSKIQEFGADLQCCKSLKKLDLSDCKHLRRTPNFDGLLSLEILWLRGCASLMEIHQSIGKLGKLIELDLSRCVMLREFPRSMSHLKSLESLDISCCSSLHRLSFDLGDLQSLKTLNAHQTGIKQWPTFDELLRDPGTLNVGTETILYGGEVHSIQSWPNVLQQLTLNLSEADIPRDIGNLSSLEFLDLSGNRFRFLTFDFSKLLLLRDLRLNNCPNLQTLPPVANLEYLRNFEVRDCKRLVEITELHNLPSISRIDMLDSSSLQNPFNKGFFSAHALALQSREDQNLIMKPELNIYLHGNEIPHWCSNTVTDSSICFTMLTHNKKYKFLGMVLWFVRKFDKQPFSPHKPLGFSFSIDNKMLASTIWPIHTVPAEEMEISYVFYRSYLETPFDGQMKGGERIEVVEKYDKENTVKQIGIHLLYLDQQGTVISLPPAILVNQTPLDVAWHSVGVDSRVSDIELLLQRGSEDEVRMVGIYGVGGIGKTTLAKAIYNRTFGQFESSCFLSNVRSEAEQYNGVVKLQEKLLHQILRRKFKVSSVDEGVNLIKARLGSKKVLVVLDDVDHTRQLESLARERSWFGSGSVIIITTRDQHVLCMLRTKERHQAKLLVDNEAQQLFSFHAFKCLSPPQEYLELAQGVIEYSGGLPLALATLGSHLQGKSVKEWGYEFKKLRAIPHCDVQKILKISFDGLDSDTQSVFLDIACPFYEFSEEEVIKILDACGFHSEIAIATLERKCLLERNRNINRYGCFAMHDLVRDMGREIVRMESTQDPGKRSRLFDPQEVRDVLQGNKGSEEVEVLMVDPRALKGVNLSTKAFQKMKNLRVLKINELKINGDLELLSKELRWLSWQNCPLEDIPSHFAAEKLVILDLCGSKIQEFGADLQCCKSLKKLDLSDCKLLRRTPNFDGLLTLEILWLRGCASLMEIHQSLGKLGKLIQLDLSYCKRLRDLPRSMRLLKSLEVLNISCCSSLQRLSFDLGDLQSLKTLNADFTGIKQWGTPLRDPVTLEVGAKKRLSQREVYCIPSWPTLLRKLQLNLFKADIPMDIENLSSLEYLDLSGNRLHCLHFDISKLLRLRNLRLNNCPNLQTLPPVANLEYLRNFEVRNCKKLVEIKELHNLPSISWIDMAGSSSLQSPFNEGFFSSHALALQSREDRNLVMKPELHIIFHCNEIPDWCSNRVRASSMCFTMPTHNKEYKFLGMVLWFVHKYPIKLPISNSYHRRHGFSFSIADKLSAGTTWPFIYFESDKDTDISYVFYRSYLETPFDGQIKGGERVEVVEKYDKENRVKQIGIHLLYLDQYGKIISLPAIVDQGRVNLQAPKVNPGMKEFATGYGLYDDLC